MKRFSIGVSGREYTTGFVIGNEVIFKENPFDFVEDEVLKILDGEEGIAQDILEKYGVSEWEVSEEEIDSVTLENLTRNEIETILEWVEQKLNIRFSQKFVKIFLENFERKGVMRLEGVEEVERVWIDPETGEEKVFTHLKKNWFAEYTQAWEFLLELDEKINVQRLVWILEAWARHALTDYDQKVGEVENVAEFREQKTREGVSKLGGELKEDYEKLTNILKEF